MSFHFASVNRDTLTYRNTQFTGFLGGKKKNERKTVNERKGQMVAPAASDPSPQTSFLGSKVDLGVESVAENLNQTL